MFEIKIFEIFISKYFFFNEDNDTLLINRRLLTGKINFGDISTAKKSAKVQTDSCRTKTAEL